MEIDKYLNRRQAAEYLGVSVTRVIQFARAGRLGLWIPAAGQYVFSRAQLARFKRRPRPEGRPKSKAATPGFR